ncbi:MAG: hypothetical protein L6Q33_15155, partial [Bacteriovoracaceae bacterium]|nr:hypothetical protein [Bacteriovoracaceae bacterium]
MKLLLFVSLFLSLNINAKFFKSSVINSVVLKNEILLPSKKTVIVATTKTTDHDCELLAYNLENKEVLLPSESRLNIQHEKVRSGVFKLEAGFPEAESITYIPLKSSVLNIELAIKCHSSIFATAS